MSKVICVDYDDTLRNRHSGMPVEGAAEAMRTLKSQGFTLIISSARLDPVLWGDLLKHRVADIIAWLAQHQIPYDQVVEHKPAADLYIDDKAYRFQGDWNQAVSDVAQLLKIT
jgi:hypothetical protein